MANIIKHNLLKSLFTIRPRTTPVTHNDIFRRLRFVFDYSDSKMIAMFAMAEETVTREQVSAWLKKDDQKGFVKIRDYQLAVFLNGLINHHRGKKDGPQVEPERRLNNNIIFRKLKIAMNFQDDDVISTMELADFRISKHELSSFFRKEGHRNYRECENQILRNFLKGLQIKQRGAITETSTENKKNTQPTAKTKPSKPKHTAKSSPKKPADSKPRETLSFSWKKKEE